MLEKKRDRLNGLKVDLTSAWKDQENARQGVATTKQTVATNEEAYASAQALYRHGKAIGLDVLQAQVDLTSSRFHLIKYAVAYEIGQARIKQIIGSAKPASESARQERGAETVKLPGRKKLIAAAIGIIILVLLAYRLIWYRPPVPVIVVKKVEVQGNVHGPGTVQSRVPVTVSAKITGILEKLSPIKVTRCKKGQLLAELDAIELRARETAAQAARNRAQRDMARAQADMVKAQANLGLAQSNYQRDLEVFKPGYISKAAFDTTKAQLKVAESEVAASKATVTALEAAVKQAESETHAAAALHNYTRIKAPMDGLITVRKAEIGTTIAPGTPIFQMVDLGQIWVAAWIDADQNSPTAGGTACGDQTAFGPVVSGASRPPQLKRPTPSPGSWKWT